MRFGVWSDYGKAVLFDYDHRAVVKDLLQYNLDNMDMHVPRKIQNVDVWHLILKTATN